MVQRRRDEHKIGPKIVGDTTHHRSPGEPNWHPPTRSRWTTVHRAVETIAVNRKVWKVWKVQLLPRGVRISKQLLLLCDLGGSG